MCFRDYQLLDRILEACHSHFGDTYTYWSAPYVGKAIFSFFCTRQKLGVMHAFNVNLQI